MRVRAAPLLPPCVLRCLTHSPWARKIVLRALLSALCGFRHVLGIRPSTVLMLCGANGALVPLLLMKLAVLVKTSHASQLLKKCEHASEGDTRWLQVIAEAAESVAAVRCDCCCCAPRSPVAVATARAEASRITAGSWVTPPLADAITPCLTMLMRLSPTPLPDSRGHFDAERSMVYFQSIPSKIPKMPDPKVIVKAIGFDVPCDEASLF